MAIFLKKFETMSQYNAYTADTENFILPNVSLTIDNSTVHYNPSSPVPPTPAYESVDLGLPSGTLWAKYNVGANSETDYGNYYQYGKGADEYAATSGQSDYSGTENPLATSADTAAQVWGDNWHMPTDAQFNELINETSYHWRNNYKNSGINGYEFEANGETLFFPASGYWDVGSLNNLNTLGCYWSSVPHYDYPWCCMFSSSDFGINDEMGRDYGFSIRPVIG